MLASLGKPLSPGQCAIAGPENLLNAADSGHSFWYFHTSFAIRPAPPDNAVLSYAGGDNGRIFGIPCRTMLLMMTFVTTAAFSIERTSTTMRQIVCGRAIDYQSAFRRPRRITARRSGPMS
jgi:hypothetical protein